MRIIKNKIFIKNIILMSKLKLIYYIIVSKEILCLSLFIIYNKFIIEMYNAFIIIIIIFI